MKKSVLVFAGLLSAAAFAGERQNVWPEGKIPDLQAHQIAATTKEASAPGFKAAENVMPYLDWYDAPAADVRTDACMILVSGGSYNCCCDWQWIDRIAKRTPISVRRLAMRSIHFQSQQQL